MTPRLILLNGPPASGKSTLAALLVERFPAMLNLDIDVIRTERDEWPLDPQAAGLAAREIAVANARVHLLAGHDVVVPQFLGRLDFIEELDALASEVGARFVEIALRISRREANDAFEQRSAAALEQTHRDAAFLVEQTASADPLGDMFDAVERAVTLRPHTRRVAVVPGDVQRTFAALVETVGV